MSSSIKQNLATAIAKQKEIAEAASRGIIRANSRLKEEITSFTAAFGCMQEINSDHFELACVLQCSSSGIPVQQYPCVIIKHPYPIPEGEKISELIENALESAFVDPESKLFQALAVFSCAIEQMRKPKFEIPGRR